ncbi:DEAD/DEAH box helicase [Actinomadura sp. LOL_016]|uniref:DEAD/DEAH box helicase n=3 Tax=unclassified Actinomadura TaxID=2626254 RepID=UPI003A87DBDD
MKPTLAAEELRENLTQYLSTTFALSDPSAREALERFLNDETQGIFRGPFLRVRTPFRKERDSEWKDFLEWSPQDFSPYQHQVRAFERLSTRLGPAEPTLITTGTGSGKTESFLLPVLDHCRRERAAGRRGVKAVLLYPMNALATDQASRVNEYLHKTGLEQVTAGLYIGDTPETGYARVMTDRTEIRRNAPDILITNYKMLDLLLQRGDDVPLWKDADPAYVVVDEFHTYDGAQGTDVAMLLRRLSAVVGKSLGEMCPVATSATLGEGGDGAEIREAAGKVFGTPFPEGAVIGEDRFTVDEFCRDLDYELPVPSPNELIACGDPMRDPSALKRIEREVTGRDDLSPTELGDVLRQHILTRAVLLLLKDGQPQTPESMLKLLPKMGAYSWGAFIRDNPERAATALARFVALVSVARTRDDHGREGPFLLVETHLWVRAVSRLLRLVDDVTAFGWQGERPVLEPDSTFDTFGKSSLPAVYCRHCGRSGWAAFSPERAAAELVTNADRIYRASTGPEKKRVRPLIRATKPEVEARIRGLSVLTGERVRPFDPEADRFGNVVGGGVCVLTDLGIRQESDNAARQDRCPACAMDEGIRYLGAGLASLAAVTVTQLMATPQLSDDPRRRKTLLFNDSVQDAAHRAGFVANRSYAFSLRRLIASRLKPGVAMPLNEVIGELAAAAGQSGVLPSVVPPDLHERPEIDAILAETSSGDPKAWDLIGERLAFQTILEFGLRSRQGRTLDLTRTAVAEVALPDPVRVAALARDVHTQVSGMIERQDDARYAAFVRGLLERLRYRGAIKHAWLDQWIACGGTKRFGSIWGRRPDGMPAFPRGLGAPTFLLDRQKKNSEFDRIDAEQGWSQDWAARCLGLDRRQAGEYLRRLLPVLAAEGIVAKRVIDGSTGVYGVQPGHVLVRALGDEEADRAGVACDRCAWQQTVRPELVDAWRGQPCPRYRCGGSLDDRGVRGHRDDYYRRLYLGFEPFRVVTAEHTGSLTRRQREDVEARFKRPDQRYNDPNVMACTPTLELGIDIGELSAVILASLPPGPANYVQRVGRAGRRSGNAFLVTMVGRRPRDLYFIDEPEAMIAGRIVPPGSYLSAIEILRRQYAAHLVDLCARGELPGVLPLPRRASALFGENGWLAGFTNAALGGGAVEGFLGLFGDDVTPGAAEELRTFAAAGLKEAVEDIEERWRRRRADLEDRLRAIDDAVESLLDSDPAQRAVRRSLGSERRGVTRLLGELGRRSAQGTLVEFGLLPNYSLLDSVTTLEATITWEEEGPDERRYHSEVREYGRSARLALTELAPGNSFYIRGYRHEIDGLDIGTDSRPAWERWRVCPGCGHVRTGRDAEADVTACSRCKDPGIGAVQNLFRVLKPTRVFAQDRRDESKIGDDSEERRRRYYEDAVAVDIDTADIAPGSWRHGTRVFGVDFTRHAVVRRFNLGVRRTDRRETARFAGEEAQLGGFHVCPSCGGTTVDGPPGEDDGRRDALIATSAADKSRLHHRTWCTYRRAARDTDHFRMILAHELRTEALRILLPVATLLVEERTASFQAALMAGVAARYGGDPDHLEIVTATMPDQATGRRRRFLVLHDTLPGGTGYLHRLADRDEFRTVLETALAIVDGCPCKGEQGKRACHRCLLSHVPGHLFDKVARAEAAGMLHDLLDEWATTSVADTSDISLWDQVESELEARFLEGMERWALRDDTPATFSRGPVVGGRKTADLRFRVPDPDAGEGAAKVVRWRVTLQNTIRGTRPDVVFRRVDDETQQVSVYLDGYAYHASPDINRLADDAAKRARLRAHRGVVFQLTWKDLDEWEARAHAPREGGVEDYEPYAGNAQRAAKEIYRKSGGNPDELAGRMWTNPVDTLFAYLAEPDPRGWLRRAEAVTAGVLQSRLRTGQTTSGRSGVGARVNAALRGEPLPAPERGPVAVCAAGPLTVILDQTTAGAPQWSGFVVVDDRDATIRADTDAHKGRWQDWLYWGNLLQFLDYGPGDGAQLALSDIDGFDAALLAAAGGDGLVSALSLLPLDEDLRDDDPREETAPPRTLEPAATVPDAPTSAAAAETSAAPEPVADESSESWLDILDLLDPDDAALAAFVRDLAAAGVPAPSDEHVGYELGDGAWQAELAWPDAKVGIVLAGDDDEARRRDDAYRTAGWDVRTVTGWTREELAERIEGAT